MKSKICFLLSKFSKGGGERVVSILSDELLKYYDVDVLLMQEKTIEDYKTNARIVELNSKRTSNNYLLLIESVINLKKYIRANKPKVIISFMELPNLVNLLVPGEHKRYISVRNHMSTKWGTKKNIWNLSIYMYKKADVVISPTRLISDDLIQNYKLKKEKIIIINNPYKISEIRQKVLPKNTDVFHIVTMGSLVKAKGVFPLLQSYIFFCKEHPEINSKLTFIGKGIEENELRQKVSEAGLTEKVEFKGFMSEPHGVLSQADLYVLASYYEGFPNALVEAMACNVPVIATNCPSGPSEILSKAKVGEINKIKKCDFGYMMPVFDRNIQDKERNLAKFFYDFYKKPNDEKKRIAETAFNRITEFDAEKVALEWKNLIGR